MTAVLWLTGAIVLVVVMVGWLRTRRQIIRRVNSVVNRLDERPSDVDHRGGGRVESVLSRLERTVDRSNERLADHRVEVERLAAVVELLGDGLVVADRTGQVVLRNKEARQYAGARHGDVLVEDAVAQVLREALAGREDVREVQVFGPPRRSLEVRGLPLLEGGRGDGAAVLVRDVSSARRVDSVRRDFVANVSHELKTPIGALTALAETLSDDDDPEVMRRLAVRVLRESQRLARIVDDLLDLSLIEAQEAPIREPVPVRLIIDQALDRVRGVADGRGVTLSVAGTTPEIVVTCDRRQLVSALFNLLDNAVKFSQLDGAEPAEVEVGARSAEGRAVIWVRDHGVGISAKDQERIFERFYRVDRARARASGGTGLGLAIVRHVAQAHGGEVVVTSGEGEGSTFSLSLPLTGADEPLVEVPT